MIYTLSQVALIAAAARFGWMMMGEIWIAVPQIGRGFIAGYRRGRGMTLPPLSVALEVVIVILLAGLVLAMLGIGVWAIASMIGRYL